MPIHWRGVNSSKEDILAASRELIKENGWKEENVADMGAYS